MVESDVKVRRRALKDNIRRVGYLCVRIYTVKQSDDSTEGRDLVI